MQAPGALRFFQKTFPVFKSFSKVYYARIVKSPLISALLIDAAVASSSFVRRGLRHGARRPGLLYPELLFSLPSMYFTVRGLVVLR